MKTTFVKVLGLALVLALTLTGCNLVRVNPQMQAQEDIAKIDKRYAVPVASYDGGAVTAADVAGEFNTVYNETFYMYQYYFGYTMTADDAHGLMEETITQHLRDEITAQHFDETMELSAEELADAEKLAKETYDMTYASALEAVEGATDEEKGLNADVLLKRIGMNYDAVYANYLRSAKAEKMDQMLRDEISELSDEELQAAYEARVSENEEDYADRSAYENDMASEDAVVCWNPEGYRTVKHILVLPTDEVKKAYTNAVFDLENDQAKLEDLQAELAALKDDDAAEDARSAEEIEADIAAAEEAIRADEKAVEAAARACLNNVKSVTKEIYAKLEAGEDFADLIAEYGEDPGMKNEPTATRGYYVSAESTGWEVNFRDAAMALANVGDYTLEPVVSGSGVHIIRYESDVPAGPVALSEVRDALYEQVLEEARDAHSAETIDAWVAAVNPSYDVEAFEKAFAGE